MSITFPTREQLVEKYLAWHRVFFPNTSTAARSDAWLEGQGIGGIGGIILARVQAVYNEIFPTTASTDGLTRHGENWLPASKRWQLATGTTSGQIRAFGTPTPIPAGTEFVHADGTRYQNPTAVTAPWGGAPWVDFDVLSIDTGAICNKAIDNTLEFVSPIAGIMSEVTVTTALEGARDDETDDEYRARILGWHHYPPGGGNFGHYKAYAEGVGGCAKAYIYPMYRGLGTVDVVCLGAGRSDDAYVGLRFAADEDAVYTELIAEVRPETADLGDLPSVGPVVGVDDPIAQAEPIDVTITPASGYEGGWAGAYTAAANPMPSLTRVNTTVDPSATVTIGKLILINIWDGAAWHPCVREVASSGASYIEVTEEFPGLTADTTVGGIQPAGAGTLAQVEALLNLFDDLTPGDTVAGSRRPIVSSDDPTDLLLADIFDVLQSLVSVANVVINLPAADVTPAAAKTLIRNERFYIAV